MTEFIKLNEEPVEIETIPDEHDETLDFEPSFWWSNRRHYTKDFLRTHNNPWLGGDFPEYIHGMQADGTRSYFEDPIYIELIGDSAVNIYKEKKDE